MEPATDWVASGNGMALDFDGSNDSVTTQATLGITTNRVTVACWVRPGRLTRGDLVARWLTGAASGDQFVLLYGIVSGKPAFYVSTGSGAAGGSTGAGTMEIGRWHHVAGTYDQSSISVFLDGVFQASTAYSAGLPTGSKQYSIGSNLFTDGYTQGQIDDVRVYDRSLTRSEIAILATRRGVAYETYRTPVVRGFSGGGAYTIAADQGSFSLTGQDAGTLAARVVGGEQASFTLSGQNANLLRGLSVVSDVGTFALTGQAADLLATRTITADQGGFTLSGQDATLTYLTAGSLAGDQGSFALAGQDAALKLGRRVVADQASFVFSGQDATLNKGVTLAADVGSFVYSGQDALLRRSVRLACDSATFAFTGRAADLVYSGSVGSSRAFYVYYTMMMTGA